MYNLSDAATLRKLLEKHGFNFSKALGQNFLIDPSVCPRMAQSAVTSEDCGVIEIGAGVGVLTAELCKRAKKVVCIELDKRLLPVLDETLSDFDNYRIVNGDILKVDLKALIADEFDGCKDICVCANLPYYITSPVIMKLLGDGLPVSRIIVMVQREAADRLTAEVGSRESGAITVAVNFYAQAKKLFEVGRESFMPSPKVDSAVIELDLCKDKPSEIKNTEFFFSMVRAIFNQRRKTAVNGISSGLGIPKESVKTALAKLGKEETVRAENLTLDELSALANELENLT
ncbi:MAG: 16S rRNA (adenine(1518)-N(6)/adenine(1519)-N(6))-dimethyltransferase RsmA [Ruminococcaceae bacterium]|nr:16S rRNA (adenine(1518)-N(6)/adenine(1519)-N(6))-dimethyltransferase RsmA [Oscillospiraceae bacterium]